MGNVNAKGRKIRGRFAHVPRDALEHRAVATLSHAQFRVLVLLAGEFNGRNNGALGLTEKQAREQGIKSAHTLYKAFRELEQRGLIQTTYPASRVPARPTMYALTWRNLDDTEYTNATTMQSNDFLKWPQDEN